MDLHWDPSYSWTQTVAEAGVIPKCNQSGCPRWLTHMAVVVAHSWQSSAGAVNWGI